MSLRGFFDHTKPARSKDKSTPASPSINDASPANSNESIKVTPESSHPESPQIRDIMYFMSQAGIDTNNDPTILNDLAKAERIIRQLPKDASINLDALSTIYQLIPREGKKAADNFKAIHRVIIQDLLPQRLNESATLILTYGHADQRIKLELFLNIKKYLELRELFIKENAANAGELFRALIDYTLKKECHLEAIATGLESFYLHSKKKIMCADDLDVILNFICQQSIQSSYVFKKHSALILLYSYDMLTSDNLAHAARNKDFVNAARVCAKYYNMKDYTLPPNSTLHIILTSLDLSNYLVVIGQFLIKKMLTSENQDSYKKEFVLQIQALLISAHACAPDPKEPNPHNVRYEDDVPKRNNYIRSCLDSTFKDLLQHNNIDKFGTKLHPRTYYRGYY